MSNVYSLTYEYRLMIIGPHSQRFIQTQTWCVNPYYAWSKMFHKIKYSVLGTTVVLMHTTCNDLLSFDWNSFKISDNFPNIQNISQITFNLGNLNFWSTEKKNI